MAGSSSDEAQLRHDLQNVQQEKLALKGLLSRAADELDNLSDANCSEDARTTAKKTAQKLRRAAAL